jgi:hypothetical protein
MAERTEKGPLSVSVGELCFVLDALRMEEEASALLLAHLGVADALEAQLVLAVSGHSLLARGLAWIGADDCYDIEPLLVRAARILTESDFMIQCNRSAGEEMTSVSFHFGLGGLLKHAARDGVVHELELMPDAERAARVVADFYGATPGTRPTLPAFRLAQASVEEIRDSEDSAFVAERLSRARVPDESARALTEDLVGSVHRGSIVRVDHRPDGTSVAEHRLFMVGGAERLWLLRPDIAPEENSMDFVQGSHETLRRELLLVIDEPAPKWS